MIDPSEIAEVRAAVEAFETPSTVCGWHTIERVIRAARRLCLLVEMEQKVTPQKLAHAEEAGRELLAFSEENLVRATKQAKTHGFTGEACVCGSFKMVRTGNCSTCQDCFASSCS